MFLCILISLFIFILGAIIGSFLNVVILRSNTGFSLGGRSGCFSCGKTLTWKELVPILSFSIQKGKCKGCKSKISWQYPIVEVLTGVIFLAIFHSTFSFFTYDYAYLSLFTFAYLAVIFSLLIVIAVYDFKHKIIPDQFVYTFIVLSFLSLFFPFLNSVYAQSFVLLSLPSLFDFLAGPLLFLPFFLLWFVSSGRWMGFGDAKLALGMGWFLGVSYGFSALLIAFYSGAVVGVSLILWTKIIASSRKRSSRLNGNANHLTIKSEVPFGPFLILGLALVFFFQISFFKLTLFSL